MALTSESTFPHIWNVPYQRNPFFTGRENLLKHLQNTLTTSKTAALAHPSAISGLGGIGKTQMAIEYAYRHQSDYQYILWVRADTYETLVSDFVTIAGLLHLSEQEAQDRSVTVNSVKHWFNSHTNWFLIFDNADDITVVRNFIPSTSEGHILLTTRDQAIGVVAQRLNVEKLEPEEGAFFLLRRANIIGFNATLDNASEYNRIIAREVSEALDGLPLAIDQAGAYIEETACSLQDYLALYQSQHAELLKLRGRFTSDHPESIDATLSLCYEKVEQMNLAAAELLRFCAFLHPDAIPEEIIVAGVPDLGPILQTVATNPFSLNTSIGHLLRYSLINRNADTHTLSIHRLVQVIVKDKLDEDQQSLWAERTIRAVNRSFPKVKFETWNHCQRYLPHAQTCNALIQQWSFVFPEAAQLLDQTGDYLRGRAQYQEAEPLFQRALAIRKQTLGATHPDTAQTLNNLALLYYDQGKYDQAEPLMQRALAIHEQALGATHTDTAQTSNNLAILYRTQDKYAQAEPLMQRALAIREQTLGATHPDTAQTLNNLALLYYDQGKYAQAEPLLQRALTIREQALGAAHPDTAQTLNDLARLYYEQGKYTQAEPLYTEALTIREQTLGLSHPNVARSLHNLALLYHAQGKLAQAESLLQQALALREQILGPEHPHVAHTLNNLALLYLDQGKSIQAKQFFDRSLSIRERAFGPLHPDVARSMNNLALLKIDQGEYGEAEPLLKRALAIREQVLGLENPYVAETLNSLANLYFEQGRYEEAELLLQRALTIREQTLGPEHPSTAQTLNDLGALYRNQGKYNQAEQLLQQALDIRKTTLGSESSQVATTLNDLGVLYLKQDKYRQAEPLFQLALSIREKALGPEHRGIVAILENYALLLSSMSKVTEATELKARVKYIMTQSTYSNSS